MYNVLNQDGKRIQVEKINPQIHKHISGRDFTPEDNGDFDLSNFFVDNKEAEAVEEALVEAVEAEAEAVETKTKTKKKAKKEVETENGTIKKISEKIK